MRQKTKILKDKIWTFEEMYDRAKVLKNAFPGETAYICTAGPTIDTFPEGYLKDKLKNELVISIKQSYHILKESADFHILNFCNFTDYDFSNNEHTITAWDVWDAQQPYDIINNNLRCDFILDTYKLGDGSPDPLKNTVSATKEWDLMSLDHSFSRPWGPGLMYEMAIPLALYMGCNKIVTIGWDLFQKTLENRPNVEGKNKQDDWFYKEISYKQTKTYGSFEEHEAVKSATKGIYEWLESQGVEFIIVDPNGNNPAYEKIKRIKSL